MNMATMMIRCRNSSSSKVVINNTKRVLLGRQRSSSLCNAAAAGRLRSFHASSTLTADALDMTDTFARRHSKYYLSTNTIVNCWLFV
jgi:hypothetical protein